MKVIFVASGNKTGGNVSSFVRSQFESLQAAGLNMILFPVSGHGWRAYLKAVWQLRKLVRRERPDIIHAHYSTCGFVASLATIGLRHRPKIMVSILGSFPTRSRKWRRVRWAIQHLWDGTLTKSERTRNQLGLDLPVIPNGVNLNIFHPMDTEVARREAFSTKSEASNIKYIVWCSHPTRPEKNWALAEDAVHLLEPIILGAMHLESETIASNCLRVELVAVYDKTPQEVATYMNAADCLLLTSWSEGSPNVIKEAMACNCPIVTTDVGDVNERLKDLEGCYVAKTDHPVTNEETHTLYAEENAHAIANCLLQALTFGNRTKGYDRILKDGLTLELTAQKIIKWYELIQ